MSAMIRNARILDLDGSVTCQGRLMERLGDRVEVVDLREMAKAVRYVPSKQASAELESAITSQEPRWLTFCGSGDFHHLSAPILKTIGEPFTLIVFDNHSDWIGSSPCPCGGWLVDALKLPNMVKLVTIGVRNASIAGWTVCHGPLGEIASGRVEVYPAECKTSKCFGRKAAQTACAKFMPKLIHSDIYWQTVADTGWKSLIKQIAGSLPTPRVYISIDKDCLAPDYAFTNWDQGRVTLDELCEAIHTISAAADVVGVDICGEYSKIEVANRIFEASAIKIHPKVPQPTDADLTRNEQTNLALVEALGF